jgi:hypothetical protein
LLVYWWSKTMQYCYFLLMLIFVAYNCENCTLLADLRITLWPMGLFIDGSGMIINNLKVITWWYIVVQVLGNDSKGLK